MLQILGLRKSAGWIPRPRGMPASLRKPFLPEAVRAFTQATRIEDSQADNLPRSTLGSGHGVGPQDAIARATAVSRKWAVHPLTERAGARTARRARASLGFTRTARGTRLRASHRHHHPPSNRSCISNAIRLALSSFIPFSFPSALPLSSLSSPRGFLCVSFLLLRVTTFHNFLLETPAPAYDRTPTSNEHDVETLLLLHPRPRGCLHLLLHLLRARDAECRPWLVHLPP